MERGGYRNDARLRVEAIAEIQGELSVAFLPLVAKSKLKFKNGIFPESQF
jgi:hypothetical protein